MSVLVTEDTIAVKFADGRVGELHRLALRDACGCADCRHPVSGQRLFESTEVVPEATVASARFEDGTLAVHWDDGHVSVFGADWLEA